MRSAPQRILPNDPDVLPALRGLFSQHPFCVDWDAHELAGVLRAQGYLNRRPHEAAVEAALEALSIEGQVLP
jgi:hypothetical protein